MSPTPSPTIAINKALVARRFARARITYDREARVQRQVTKHTLRLLTDELSHQGVPQEELATHFRHIVELGCGPGTLSRQLCRTFHPDSLLLNDLCPEMEECLHDVLTPEGVASIYGTSAAHPTADNAPQQVCPTVAFMPGDAETLALPSGTDLIISCSTMQWFASPRAFFQRCQQALAPGGMLVVSTFGPDNLREIRALTGNGLAYPSLDELCTLLPTGLSVLHCEEERLTLTFDNPAQVLHHLKLTGATGTDRRLWTPSRLRTFCQDYAARFRLKDNDGVGLTYHPIYLLAQKRDKIR